VFLLVPAECFGSCYPRERFNQLVAIGLPSAKITHSA
jgi:hypothetical protein